MKLFKAATAVSCMALMGAILAPGAKADDWNRKTTFTFSSPVAIPGVHLVGFGVLPAGTYVFKILNSMSDRHIVQIFNKEENIVYATILAIPNYRLKATDKTVMTFTERPAGEPEALRAWFYPGRNWGEEFVYPKAQAMALAKSTNGPVLFSSAENSEVAEPTKPEDASVVAMRTASVMAAQPSGEEVQLAEVVTPPPAEVAAEVVTAPAAEVVTPAPAEVVTPAPAQTEVAATTGQADRALPETASTLPLMAFLGLLALGGFLALRVAEKRVQ